MDDAARAILMAAEDYNGQEPVNIGTGEEITIQKLAHLSADEVGYKGEFVWDTGKPNGQPRRCLDTTRAKQLFGFEAAIKLRAGLRTTIGWFQANRESFREVVF